MTTRRSAALFTAIAIAMATPAARADEPVDLAVQEARILFEEGAKMAEVGRCDDAIPTFERSHALRPHAQTTYNIALCERSLSRYTRAQRTFERALDEDKGRGGGEIPAEIRASIERYIVEVSRRIARVRVTVDASDVAIAVDGRPLTVERRNGRAEAIAGTRDPGRGEVVNERDFDLALDQGTHVIVLSRAGYLDSVITETFDARRSLPLALRAPLVKRPPSTKRDERSTGELVFLYGTTITWGVGLGLTVGAGIASNVNCEKEQSNGDKCSPIKAAAVLASAVLIPAIATTGIFLLDRSSRLRSGAANAAATGLILGFESGLFTALSMTREGQSPFSDVRAATITWGMSAIGGVVGGVLGQTVGVNVRSGSIALSGGLWGGLLVGFFAGGIAGARGDGGVNTALAAGGLIGTTAGAMTAGAFSNRIRFSLLRMRLIDLSALGGGVLGWGISAAALSKSELLPNLNVGSLPSTSPILLIGAAAGVSAGLGIGMLVTDGMKPDETDPSSILTMMRPSVSPQPGGAIVSFGGML